MQIPKILLDNIRDGQVVLFLGSGASKGAIHPENKQPPDANKLAEMICDNFLEKEYRNRPLSQIAELAISETNLFKVQEFVASIFKDFMPAEFHKLITQFIWTAIEVWRPSFASFSRTWAFKAESRWNSRKI